MIQESAKSDASRPASAPRPPGIYPRSPRTGPPTKLPIRQVQGIPTLGGDGVGLGHDRDCSGGNTPASPP
jgi:hypothetical protein